MSLTWQWLTYDGHATFVSGHRQIYFDLVGQGTGDETGRKFVYDAWNRLVTVKDSSNNVLESFAYDGVNRRVSTTANSTTTDLYYSDQWQVLEERIGGNTTMQYVWAPVYVDAMVLRDRDTDANGSLDERLWVQQDANLNATALLDNSGAVVERYAYDPYGNFTIYDASWGSRSSSSYGWVYQHQGLRYDGGAGLYHARARDLSPSLGRWLQNDALEYRAGDTNIVRALSNNPNSHLDPTGLWAVARTNGSRAEAISERNDTVGRLADKIGLDSGEFKKWLALPNGSVKLVNGKRKWLSQLNLDDMLCAGQRVQIPNEVVAIWAGDWGSVGQAIVGWGDDLSYLRRLGFHVQEVEANSSSTYPQEADIQTIFRNGTTSRDIHGLFVWGHGDAAGFGSHVNNLRVDYRGLEQSMKYHMALVILFVCNGGWSRNDNPGGIPGYSNGIAAGGRDLVANSPEAFFWGLKRTLVPVLDPSPLRYLFPSGKQATRKLPAW